MKRAKSKAGLLLATIIVWAAQPLPQMAFCQAGPQNSTSADDLSIDSTDTDIEDGTEQITSLTTQHDGLPIRLKKGEGVTTAASFKPPIAITIVAKTNGPDLRIAYAADQVIFDWEKDQEQLRVDGGPGDGKHKMGEGRVPINQYVKIRWEVTPDGQKIYVNGELRFEHHGDYSHINNPITVFPGSNAIVTIKSIKTKPLTGSQPTP
jgi:hypothetical protein